MSKCEVCDYTSDEVLIVNDLCSVHTCEVCGAQGFATQYEGRILCDEHETEITNSYI
jgi:hypothetical protein